MSFNYKNPISPITVLGTQSVPRENVFGTNFSVLSTGGYMEVYSLSDLYFTIPTGTLGLVEYSGNSIPIQLNVGSGQVFSPNVLTLNSDNISSGRRRIGMLVYVIEEEQIYQFQIPNFETLWNNALSASGPGGNTVVMSDFGTTIKSNSPAGITFISAWTANTIEGVGSQTSTTAVWKKFKTGETFTGGTITGATYFSNGLSANTFSATTYLGLPADFNTFVTGYTYNNNTFTISDNSGNTFNATINDVTGLTVNGTLLTNVISATTYQNLPADYNTFVTGYTYNDNTFTISDNSGNTFDATINDVTGLTVNGTLLTNVISATTYQNLPVDYNTFVTGYSYNNNTFTISDNSGNTFNATINTVTGLTVNGTLKTNIISATTYQNLPADFNTFVTGYTYNNNTFTISDNSGGTFNATINTVTGLTVNGTLFSNIVSATTYQNLPIDVFVTGGTFTGGSIIFRNNTGGTFSVSGISSFDTFVTGLTYNNNTLTLSQNSGTPITTTINSFTGLTINGGLSATSISASTYFGIPSQITVGSTQVISGTSGNIFFQSTANTINQNSNLFWDNTNSFLSIGQGNSPGARLDVRAQGALSTDIAFRIRNSGNTLNLFQIGGDSSWISRNNSNSNQYIYWNGTSILELKNDSAGAAAVINNTAELNIQGATALRLRTGDKGIYIFNTGNFYIGNATGIQSGSGQGNILFANNTAPTTNIADHHYYYSADIVAGNASPHFRTENGSIVRLYQNANTVAINDVLTNTGLRATGGTSNFSTGISSPSITANTAVFSANSQNIVTIYGSGSTQPIFTVQGSSGQLFSITDSLVGELFSVNNISGLPILSVSSDDTIQMGSYLAPSLYTTNRATLNTGTTTIYSFPTSAYTGAFIDYTLQSTTGARSGSLMSIFSGSSVQFNETTTLDIGSTSAVTMGFVVSGTNANFTASTAVSGFTIKSIIRSI